MKAKIIIILGCMLMIIENSSGQNWNKISKDIMSIQISQYPNGKDEIHNFYKLRKKSNCLDKFSPVNENDTIFILDRFVDFNSLDLFSTHWNQRTQVSIKSINAGKTFSFVEGYTFTKYMLKLVSEWNLEEIKNEEVKNKVISSNGIFATRIIFNRKKYIIDCFYFNDFFNMKRDYMDFRE